MANTNNSDNSQISALCKIRDVYKAISEFEVDFQKLHDLGMNEGMLLCSLNTQKYSSNELADKLGLSNSNTSKIIKSVEKKGLIERIIGEEDKRQMYFTLTNSGRKKMEQIKCSIFDIPELLRSVVKP